MYFNNKSILNSKSKTKALMQIKLRRQRGKVDGFTNSKYGGYLFSAGDILRIVFEKGPVGYFFEGICLSIHNRNLLSKNTTLMVRNVIMGVGVEMIFSYYLNRIYRVRFNDYKRKHFFYGRPRLYYLRDRVNRESRVK